MKQKSLNTKQRIIRSLILIMCLGSLLLTCLQVIGHGYLPSDDALRHVAKVLSEKPWAEILLVRPEITMDSHPGWHAILSFFQKITGSNKISLLNFSIICLFLIFTIPPVLYLKRGEAWIAALALSAVFFFGSIYRLFYGRPYIISMALVLLFCFLWEKIRDKKRPWAELAILSIAVALATWIHGTWYLYTLPLLALVIARQWRVFLLMSGAMAAGIIIGAMITASPLIYLHQMIFQVIEAFGNNIFLRQLVGEFQPFNGEMPVFFMVGGLLFWRWARREWDNSLVDNPVFYLAVIGWIMGFYAVRFWLDWSWPALAFWVAKEIQAILEYYSEYFSLKRLAMACVFCLVLLLAVTNDRGNRWSGVVSEWPNMENETHKPWLPSDGGIIYNDDMRLFYEVFYLNPYGTWRYALGFEPAWMPEDDLKIYRHIQLSRGKNESYQAWVQKMTEKDRMIIIRNVKPGIEGLDWHEVTPTVWSGKIIQK